MKRLIYYALLMAVAVSAEAKDNVEPIQTTKQERNYITEGNKLYRDKRFAEAEVMYRKALELVPGSETASYNLAAALIRQSGSADPNAENNPLKDAQQLLQQLSAGARDISIAEKAFYNLGNMAFNQENYAQAIEMYKHSLRKNPDNDKTRENLRLAQIKLKEQQQNQDQNQNQNQQDQQEQKNQDQNKNDDKNQQKDDQQQNQQQEQEKEKKPQQQPRQETSISDANAEKILKAMENEEAATRRRVEAQKKQDEKNSSRRQVTNPW